MCVYFQNEAAWQRWVVVFGFTNEFSSGVEKVLQEFQQFGDIDNYALNNNNGNWLFIRFISPENASRAEQHNGSCLGSSNQMVGVIRLCAGESSHKYRLLLQHAQTASGTRPNIGSADDGRQREGVCASLLNSQDRVGREARETTGNRENTGDGALRHRREALGSAAYR